MSMSAKIEFHEDMSQLKDKIQSILKGPLRKDQIYFVNGQHPDFGQEKSLSEKMRQSKSRIENNDNQASNRNNMRLK